MTEAQKALAEQLAITLGKDPRILSVWLSGSLGQGQGDPWSDVDILAVVAPDHLRPCLDDYLRDRPNMPATVLRREIYGRIVTAICEDWSRFDITFALPAEFARANGAELKPLAGDVANPPPAHPVRGEGRIADIAPMIQEFIRVIGLAPVPFGREEWVVSQQGVEMLRNMLVDLMLAEQGVGREMRGAKRLNPFLTEEQRAILEGLEPPRARREDLLAANQELAHLFFSRAKPLAAKAGIPWPQAFEDATRRHLKAELGLEF